MFNEIANQSGFSKPLIDEPNIKLSINEKGTKMMKYAQLFKTEYIFDPSYKMDKIVAALHNSSIRSKWD